MSFLIFVLADSFEDDLRVFELAISRKSLTEPCFSQKLFLVFPILDHTARPNPRHPSVSCDKILTTVASVSMDFSLVE